MISLPRYYTPLDMGTFGILNAEGVSFYTIELPWRKNARNISCIPEGTYHMARTMFWGGDGPGGKRDYETFEILGVVGRTHIKIHIGQTPEDLAGCVGIGNALGVLHGRWAVLNSAEAHAQFMRLMQRKNEAEIRIYQAIGEK